MGCAPGLGVGDASGEALSSSHASERSAEIGRLEVVELTCYTALLHSLSASMVALLHRLVLPLRGLGSPMLAAWGAFALVACGGAETGRHVDVEETRVVAHSAGGETSIDVFNADTLFAEAQALVEAGQCEEGVARFDVLVREFPSSRLVAPALYNAGLCLQQRALYAPSVAHYAELVSLRPDVSDVKFARLQMADGLEHLERWPDALENADAVLARTDLASHERLEAMARRARAILGLGRVEDARTVAGDAMTYYRTRRGDEVIAEEYFAAAANFVLAETVRLRSEAIVIPAAAVTVQHEALDRRATLLLEAQRAYFDTIRLTNPYWASAAGFRIGAMYDALYDAVMSAPIPPPNGVLSPEGQQLYETEYRRELGARIRPLMQHAVRYWELTLVMIERTGVETEWRDRLQNDLERVRARLVALSAS